MGCATRIILIRIDIYSNNNNNKERTGFIRRPNVYTSAALNVLLLSTLFSLFSASKSISIWCDFREDEKMGWFNWMLRIVICKCHCPIPMQEMVGILIANWCANSVSFINNATSYFFFLINIICPISTGNEWKKKKLCIKRHECRAFCLFHGQSLIKIRFYRTKSAQFVKHSISITCVRFYSVQ